MIIRERKGGWRYAVIFDRPQKMPNEIYKRELQPLFDWVATNCVGSKVREIPSLGWAIDLKTKADLLLFKLTWGGYACRQTDKV